MFLASSNALNAKEYIDTVFNSCVTQDPSTMGMVTCANKAYDNWDRELNKYYRLLMSELSAQEKKDLKTAQIAWIDYRDKEFENMNSIHDKLEGTMYLVIFADKKVDFVKRRALELKDYYKLLKQGILLTIIKKYKLLLKKCRIIFINIE